MSQSFQSKLSITHITTATALITIDGVNFITDPVFGPSQSYASEGVFEKVPDLKKTLGLDEIPQGSILTSFEGPAIPLESLPHIDAVLLSHEDHIDNLDAEGRKLLDGRKVFTTMDGKKNLQPRPSVYGLRPWEKMSMDIGGKAFTITGTPCKHFPGGEVTGFILESPSFGHAADGLPNAIYISGDTVYLPELGEIGKKWHISAAILNLGAAKFEFPIGTLMITMDGKQASQLVKEIGADVLVPLHFESWAHFTEHGDDLKKVFKEEGIEDKICWLTPGVEKTLF